MNLIDFCLLPGKRIGINSLLPRLKLEGGALLSIPCHTEPSKTCRAESQLL